MAKVNMPCHGLDLRGFRGLWLSMIDLVFNRKAMSGLVFDKYNERPISLLKAVGSSNIEPSV